MAGSTFRALHFDTHPTAKGLPAGNKVEDFHLNMVRMQLKEYGGQTAAMVNIHGVTEEDYKADSPTFAWLPLSFHDGVIEVEVAGTVAAGAPDWARGFIGIGFRIQENLSFEGIYLRPANGRAEDQVRRNHTTQYFSYPDYPFDRMRREFPERYESYVDLALGQWTKMRIEVAGEKARLFVHGAEQPCLLVNDLKLGPGVQGGVGLWVDYGTEGYFRNLTITCF